MSDRESMLKKLEDVHDFPGAYVFKVIGPNNPEFLASVVQSVINVTGPESKPEVKTKESSGAKHVSVTVVGQMPSAESVLEVYSLLRSLDDAKFVL